jgi:adenylylsulfate kinase-like enzyme
VARLMNEAGLICICAVVAPSAAVLERARQASERFVEIHLSAPDDVPVGPDLSLDTLRLTVDECVERIVTVLADKLGPPGLGPT